MDTSNQESAHAEIERIMSDGRFDRACKTVETLTNACALWPLVLYAVSSDAAEIAVDVTAVDPEIERLYQMIESTRTAKARANAEAAWEKRSDAIEAWVLGWMGLSRASVTLSLSRDEYERVLQEGRLMARCPIRPDEPLMARA